MAAKLITILLLAVSAGLPRVTQNPLAGSWRLISYTDISPAGMPYLPFGTHPIGEFLYAADGHFSADIRSDANGSVPPDLPRPEFDDLMGPFLGYFGTYRFDPATSTVEYNIAGASAPSYVMSDAARMVRFDGNRVILTGQSTRRNGHTWTWERVLERDTDALSAQLKHP